MCPPNFKEIQNLGKTHIQTVTPWKFNSSPLKIGRVPKGKDYHFPGAMLSFRGVTPKLDIRFPKVEDGERPDITDGTSDDDGFTLASKLEGPNMRANKHEISPGKSNSIGFHNHGYIWMFPKIVGFPPKHPLKNRGFPIFFNHPFWGFYPYFWISTHIGFIFFLR